MTLTCKGCAAVIEADNPDALCAAMMAHGDEVHASHFEGKTPEQIQQIRHTMETRIRQLIADQAG